MMKFVIIFLLVFSGNVGWSQKELWIQRHISYGEG